MKYFTILFLFTSFSAFTQSKSKVQNSLVSVTGNNNVIKVIQAEKVIEFNLSEKKQSQDFIKYLQLIKELDEDMKILLKNNSKTLAIVKKITIEGYFNTAKFITELKSQIKENFELIKENERLRAENKNSEFAKIIERANKKLKEFNDKEYQNILEEGKIAIKNKSNLEVSQINYLQAKNNFNTRNLEKSLEQINEALINNNSDVYYLTLKGEVLFNLSQFNESLMMYNELLKYTKQDSLIAFAYERIGVNYYWQGGYENALTYYTRAYSFYEKLYGKKDLKIGRMLSKIGLVYYEKQDYGKALEYYLKDLKIENEHTTIENENFATCFNNIATVYFATNKFDSANLYLQKALVINERLFGIGGSGTSQINSNLSLFYLEKGDFIEALIYQNKALNFREATYGKNHIYTANSYSNIGKIYERKGIYDSAICYFLKEKDILEKVLGEEHSYSGNCYFNMSKVYLGMENYDEALKYSLKSLSVAEIIFGEEKLSTSDCFYVVGLSYFKKKNYENALPHLNKALSIKQKLLSQNDEDFIDLFNAIGLCYAGVKQYTLALNNYLKELDLKKYHNEENENTATLYSNIGAIYSEQGQYDKSINYYLNSLRILERSRTQNDEIIRHLIFLIGYMYITIDQKLEGLSYIEKSGFSDFLQIGKSLLSNGLKLGERNEVEQSINVLNVAAYFLEQSKTQTAKILSVTAYENLSANYCLRGDKSLAKAMAKRALELSKKIKSPNTQKKRYKDCKIK